MARLFIDGNEITNNETNNEDDSMELATQKHIDQATKSKLDSLNSRVSALESGLQNIKSTLQSIQSSQSNYPSY